MCSCKKHTNINVELYVVLLQQECSFVTIKMGYLNNWKMEQAWFRFILNFIAFYFLMCICLFAHRIWTGCVQNVHWSNILMILSSFLFSFLFPSLFILASKKQDITFIFFRTVKKQEVLDFKRKWIFVSIYIFAHVILESSCGAEEMAFL